MPPQPGLRRAQLQGKPRHRWLCARRIAIEDGAHKVHASDRKLPPPTRHGQNDPEIKEATIKTFHYPDLESLKAHVLAFVCASNFAKHLKALRRKTPTRALLRLGRQTRLNSKPIPVTSLRYHTPKIIN